jgi:hypothetical protein
MGAIFNTDKTLKILKFLNKHYEPGVNFEKARTNQEHLVLRDFPHVADGFGCAKKLGLHDTSVNARWKKWLDFLDAHEQDSDYGGPLVRRMMAEALLDPSCIGIEFFAVPAPKFSVHHPAPKVYDTDDPNKYTIEIIVETNTIDNLVSFAKRQKRRRK